MRRWQREGALCNGRAGSWQWTDAVTGERLASIGYRADGMSVELNYSIDGRDCSQRVRLESSACNHGGARPWFVCPIRGERVAVLYLRAGRFACRHCQRRAYVSQSATGLAGGWQRQHRIEAQLGADWQRPKGMHHARHVRLLSILVGIAERRDAALDVHMGRLLERYPSLRGDSLFSKAWRRCPGGTFGGMSEMRNGAPREINALGAFCFARSSFFPD